MSKVKPDKREMAIRKIIVAKCLAKEWKESEIGKILEVSQPTISRLREKNPHLRKEKYVFELASDTEFDAEELEKEAENRISGLKTKNILKEISPYKCFQVDIMYGNEKYSVESGGFDHRATRIISRYINQCSVVGVAWDFGIKPYSTSIPGFVKRDNDKNEEPISFIPLCGITSRIEGSVFKSSSTIAMTFSRLVNSSYYPDHHPKLLNLNCIPMVHPPIDEVPPKYDGVPDSEEVISYLRNAFPDYEYIFGKMADRRNKPGYKGGIANNVDMIFTGVGTREKDGERLLSLLYPGKEKKIAGINITKKRLLNEVIVGDIAGVLLPDTESSNAERNKEITDQLNHRLATLRPQHLTQCCDKAENLVNESRELPGVVVIAHGKSSYRSVIEGIRSGYISSLIIDYELAEEIENQHKNEAD